MPGDLMDQVFGDIKNKPLKKDNKPESLIKGTLSKEALSNETLSDEALRCEGMKAIDIKLLQQAVNNANNKRKMIGVWSPIISATMWYLKATIPMFSISETASRWIEEGLEREYPELVRRIKAEMNNGR